VSARSTTRPSIVTRTLRAAILVLAGAGVALGVSSGTAHADTVHGPYTLTTSACATCHRAHTGQGPMLLDTTGSATLKSPTTTLCLTCHNGTGARPDLVTEYATATPNNEATRSYFQHEVTTVTSHTLGTDEEFLGVLNRHSECTDCHNPHSSGSANSVSSPVGQPWTASQRILGTSGVQVTNGSPRTYTFLNGTSSSMTAEYQLCLKCHSGYTKLLPDIPGQPSKNMTDVAVEFDPANSSYHPVEAAGRNTTPAMAASLAGTSQFKLWNFTTSSTVRCTSCHSSDIAAPATSGVTAGSSLAPHTSSYRGILVQKYEDRVLNTASANFSEANFALCFLCHADSPFISGNRSATNFSLHEKHVADIRGQGSITGTIDTPGAGQGNAICAECHFRPHSTATDPAQETGLVAFAPNVLANGGAGMPTWTSTTPGRGSCTLTCHGQRHSNESYGP
jgi:predicted CXXCH cytochrome family protein